MTLSYTASDGSLSTFTFTPASVADYNAAVAAVRGGAAQAQQQKQQAEAQAQAAQQAAQARQQAESDANSVAGDLEDLRSKANTLRTDVDAVAGDLAQMRKDVAVAHHDLLKVLAERTSLNCGADSAQVSGTDEAQVAGTDDAQINGTDEATISNDKQSVQSAISQLQDDNQTLLGSEAAASGYVPATAPSSTSVGAAIADAHAALAYAAKKWTAYTADLKELEAQVNSYGNQADAACTG